MADDLAEFFSSIGSQAKRAGKSSPRSQVHHDTLDNPGNVVSADAATGDSRWSEADGLFWRAKKTHEIIPSGLYNCQMVDGIGPALRKQELKTDDLLILPEKNSSHIFTEFERFWTLEQRFVDFGYLYKRGFLLWGPPGCHAKGTRVIMYDGTTKAVEEVAVGDLLMGPDSTPRRVLELCRGRDKMYDVLPTKGKPFVVNQHHILSLHPSGKGHAMRDRFNMSVKSFLAQSNDWQVRSKLYRADTIHWPKQQELPIPPYIMGLWLGDGSSNGPALTNMDSGIISEWSNWVIESGWNLDTSGEGTSTTYHAKGDVKTYNPARRLLKELGVLENKHIPQQYMLSSVDDRLQLLAGLMDTDGSLGCNFFDISSKSAQLAEDIVSLCRSLGFAAYSQKGEKGCHYKGHKRVGTYWRMGISGNCDRIPTRLTSKQATPRLQIKDHLVTGFKLRELPVDDYYGFVLNGDHLYLLDDYTVTHNSGKTSLINLMMKTIIQRYNGIIVIIEDPDWAVACLGMVRKNEPERPLITILEDLDALVERWGEAGYLNLLDGSEQINNVIHIGTTNYPERLDRRFVDRPSRFDTVVKIGMPGWDAREQYFRSKLDNKDLPFWDVNELERWTKMAEGFSVAHMREMIISVCCLGQNIEDVVLRLEKMHKRLPSSEKDPDGPAIGFIGNES